jgi:type III secretion protein V
LMGSAKVRVLGRLDLQLDGVQHEAVS